VGIVGVVHVCGSGYGRLVKIHIRENIKLVALILYCFRRMPPKVVKEHSMCFCQSVKHTALYCMHFDASHHSV